MGAHPPCALPSHVTIGLPAGRNGVAPPVRCVGISENPRRSGPALSRIVQAKVAGIHGPLPQPAKGSHNALAIVRLRERGIGNRDQQTMLSLLRAVVCQTTDNSLAVLDREAYSLSISQG